MSNLVNKKHQKITREKAANAAIKLAYDGYGAVGVYRFGCHDVPREVFKIALSHYLETGENKLGEYSYLMGFWEIYGSGGEDEERMIKTYKKAFKGETFWNICALYSERELKELKNDVKMAEEEWKNSKTYEYRRHNGFTDSLKQKTKDRDDNQCVKCGSKKNLVVHHKTRLIDGGTNNPKNLVTLCRECHRKTHKEMKKKREKEENERSQIKRLD